MGSLNVINGDGEHILSPTHTKKWSGGNVALSRCSHGFTQEDIADNGDPVRLFQQVIEILQCYIHSLRQESVQASMEASTATSQAESAARSSIHKLCSEIHALVSRPSRCKSKCFLVDLADAEFYYADHRRGNEASCRFSSGIEHQTPRSLALSQILLMEQS